MTGPVDALVALAEALEARAQHVEARARQVPVPGSETGRQQVAMLHARASALREAASEVRAQVQALLQVQP